MRQRRYLPGGVRAEGGRSGQEGGCVGAPDLGESHGHPRHGLCFEGKGRFRAGAGEVDWGVRATPASPPRSVGDGVWTGTETAWEGEGLTVPVGQGFWTEA